MKISNRTLGYISFVVLVGLIAYISYSMYMAHQNVSNVAIVDFDELGTLQPEDPVVIRGYRVGTIGTVNWLGDRARITVKFDTPVVLREGTEFNNVNFALMGQRRLEITPSKTGKVMPPDYIFTGNFEPGIAEALRLIENVNDQVSAIRDVILLLANGDSTHQSVTEVYETTLGSIEAFLDNTDKQLAEISPQLDKLFKQADQATAAIGNATVKIDTAAQTITKAINEKLNIVQTAMQKASEGTAKANRYMADIEENVLSKDILKTTATLEKINEVIEKLNKLVQAINTKGIKVYDENGKPVKLIKWKNMNIIGQTARSKAKERAEKSGTAKPEATSEATKPEAAKSEAPKSETAKQETAKPAVQPASSQSIAPQSSANP